MKQRITKEQWEELSEEEQRKFANCLCFSLLHFGEGDSSRNERSVYPTIGQMIEFLGEDEFDSAYTRPGSKKIKHNNVIEWEKEGRLCDALWEACKVKLTD